ncbi:MAG: hypothetical protein ACRC7S_20100, partial [Cetobacterium sp.]
MSKYNTYDYKDEFVKIIVVKKINGELFQISKEEAIKKGLKFYEITLSEYKNKLQLYNRIPSKNFVMHPDTAKEQGLLYTQEDIENWLNTIINDTMHSTAYNDQVVVVKKINGEVIQMS